VPSPSHRRLRAVALPLLTVVAFGLGVVPGTFGAEQSPSARAGATAHAPSPIVVRPAALHRGSPPVVPWLVDNVVHTGEGRTVTLPWTRAGARRDLVRLVGHISEGWLVKSFDGGDTWTLWSVKAGRRHAITSASVSEGEVVGFRLSDNHRRFLVHSFDGDSTTSISVRNLDNTQVDGQEFADDREVLAFSGPELVVGATDTQHWDVDAQSVDPLGVDAAGADLRHDLLFVTDPASGESGPTSLVGPGAPAWTAAMRQVVVAPSAGRLLSRGTSRASLLSVRNLETGTVRVSFAVRFLASEAPVWEGDRSFVFIAAVGGLGDRETLVRCRVNGSCTRVSAIRPRDAISLPQR